MQLKNKIAEAEKLTSRQEIKSCARHIFRDRKMKKLIMTFAIVAFLVGGFTINASAQEKVKAKTEQQQKEVNYDKMLDDYETNVDLYIAAYEKSLKADQGDKVGDYSGYLKKAQDLENKLLKDKEKLNRSQADRFQKIQKKLAKALTKK